MLDYRFRSVRPDGLVMHELGATSTSLAEAQAYACLLARSLVAAGPEGKSWDGWYVDVLDMAGRMLLGVPFTMASSVRKLPDLTPAGGRAWRTTTMNFT